MIRVHWLVVAALVGCSANAPKTGGAAVSTAAARQPRTDPEPPSFRLPNDVRPTRYRLDLTIDPSADLARGKVTIDVDVAKPVHAIWLHATPELQIQRAQVAGAPSGTFRQHDVVGLIADRPAGSTTLELEFTAPIDHERSRGLYSEQEAGESYAYTFFEATDARRAFPCFDEPGFKTPWTIVLHVKKDHIALANTAIVNERDEGTMKGVEFAPTKPLPSYLVAFIVGPFDVIDGGTGGRAKTPIRFAVPKGRAGELGWAKNVTPRVVAALEDYFDMAYPFGKLDVAVVPRYWGTMEHPGIVAMGQPLTLIKPGQETRKRKQHYTSILAHELAHYWFGDYVTMAWWNDAWLNESFGTWMDLIITDAVEPTWRLRDDRPTSTNFAMEMDETLATQAIRQPVTTPEAIETMFDSGIVYAKGASVTRMIEAWIGPDRWRDFIHAYMAKFAWGTASADDLFALVRERLGTPAELALRSFIEQPGTPLISYELRCEAKQIVMRQTRALPLGQTDPATPRWHVPVCFRYGDARTSHESCTMLDTAEATAPVETCPTWLVPNLDARGYYRSSVDPKLVTSLFDPRNPLARIAKPTSSERVMLVTDLRNAVSRGELSIDKVLALAPLVIADADPKVAVWAAMSASFRADALDDRLYQLAREWSNRTFGPPARRLGWTRLPSDSDELHQLRIALLPMVADTDRRLASEAARLVDRWLRERKGLDDDVVDAALEIAAANGDTALFERYVQAAKSASDRTEKTRLLHALGGFRDPGLAKRALELVLGTEYDLRDTSDIVLRLIDKRETRDIALAFVEHNIDALLPRMRDDEATKFMATIAGAFCDAERRDRATKLLTPRAKNVGGAEAAVNRGLGQSNGCIVELARQRPDLQTFLRK